MLAPKVQRGASRVCCSDETLYRARRFRVAIAPPALPGTVVLVFFALFFGAALGAVPEAKRRPVVAFFEGFYEAILLCINAVMKIAPSSL